MAFGLSHIGESRRRFMETNVYQVYQQRYKSRVAPLQQPKARFAAVS
jgi:hypothetical protein